MHPATQSQLVQFHIADLRRSAGPRGMRAEGGAQTRKPSWRSRPETAIRPAAVRRVAMRLAF